MLGEVRRLVVDVGHSDPHRGGAGSGDLAFVNRHHNKLIQVVHPLVVQRPSWENGPVRGNDEVRAERVIGEIGVLPGVTVAGRHWGEIREPKRGKRFIPGWETESTVATNCPC